VTRFFEKMGATVTAVAFAEEGELDTARRLVEGAERNDPGDGDGHERARPTRRRDRRVGSGPTGAVRRMIGWLGRRVARAR
jgi:hypothetical protein